MNYTSDQLFNKVFLSEDSHLTDSDKNKVVEDLINLSDLLTPNDILGAVKIKTLVNLRSESLVLLHIWNSELFAIKHFKDCGINPSSENILGIYS